jgi:dolichyl-phosphate-mannose--protein O-mannosyl transferase
VSRPQFIFYVLPMTPFLVLAAAYTLRDLSDATIVLRDPASGHMVESRRHPYRPLVWGYVVAAVALFVWFYPVLTAHPLSPTMWKARVWFQRWA